jgi:hypothetical protein
MQRAGESFLFGTRAIVMLSPICISASRGCNPGLAAKMSAKHTPNLPAMPVTVSPAATE